MFAEVAHNCLHNAPTSISGLHIVAIFRRSFAGFIMKGMAGVVRIIAKRARARERVGRLRVHRVNPKNRRGLRGGHAFPPLAFAESVAGARMLMVRWFV